MSRDRPLSAFLVASRLQAALESTIPLLTFSAIFGLSGGLDEGYLTFGLVIGPLCALLYAARARLETAEVRRQTVSLEARYGIFVAAVPATVGTMVATQSGIGGWDVAIGGGLLLWNATAIAIFRAIAWQWPRWSHLRRSSLRWQMTHSSLLAVAVAATIAIVLTATAASLLGGVQFNDEPDPSAGERLVLVLAVLGGAVFLSVVALGVMLPIAAAVSSYTARRTARRLETLTSITGRVAAGDLTARVTIDGEDEIARLQEDFNAMAAALEDTVTDLQTERQRVEQLLTTQRDLVASISHELRTPIATASGYLESVLDRGNRETGVEGDSARDLEIAWREIRRLDRLVGDLFDLARAERGQLLLSIEPVLLQPLINSSVDALSAAAWRAGRVDVVAETEATLPSVLADAGRLEQVIRNLLQNAIRHTPPGGIVAIGASFDDTTVTVDVTDTGEGIPPDQLDHIFERFHRLEPARRRDQSGAGLGLALVKELTEAMGGTVTVESEVGQGTCFAITLPRAESNR